MTFFQVPVSISKRSKLSTAFLVNVGCTNFLVLSKVSIDTYAGIETGSQGSLALAQQGYPKLMPAFYCHG